MPPAPTEAGWRQKLMVYGTIDHVGLIRRLRADGAAGATALRGIWGYHGDHEAHGDRALSLRRRAPVLTIAVDEPAQVARWWSSLDAATASSGLVTSELVPVVSAAGS